MTRPAGGPTTLVGPGRPAHWAVHLAPPGRVRPVGGLAVSLVAFLMALVTRMRHREVSRLWLPLALVPSLTAVVAAVELFWTE